MRIDAGTVSNGAVSNPAMSYDFKVVQKGTNPTGPGLPLTLNGSTRPRYL